jgi:outer membrane protein insertion porin family
VDVTFREPPPTDDQQNIEYLISRGPRRKLVHVEVVGNKYFDRDTIRERMFLEPSSIRFRWGRFSQAFRKKDEETITNLYKSNGFRDVRVTSVVENNYQGKPNRISVVFTINEGPQWRVDHLTLKGVDHLNHGEIIARISSGDGQPYSEVNVATDRNTITSMYFSRGFRHSTFEWSASPSDTPNHVNLEYRITEGSQEFIRDVLISGLKITRRDFVKRNLTVSAGDPISLSRVRETQRRLYDLGVFSKVDTAVQNNNGDETVKYVLYDFDEAHRYNFNVGVGAEIARIGGTSSNLTQPAGAAGFSPRVSMDLTRLNMLGLGHTASLQTRVSNLEQRVSLSYVDPKLYNDPNRALTFTTFYSVTRDVRTFSSRREEAAVQFSQKVSKPSTLFFRFAYRRVTTNDVVIPSLLIPQLLQPVRIGILSVNWIQDRRDNSADAHSGMYNTVETGVASNIFGSQRSYVKILGRNATYHRINRDWVFARQTNFGAILPFRIPAGVSSADSVPLPERFYAGGSVSHRGFPENQAGPRDIGTPAGPGGIPSQPTGFPLGGNAVLINNLELRFPLLGENIGGVLFHDAGNVYRSIGDISVRFHQKNDQDFNYMVHAVGFGIRYKTPVGPVRVDLAYSINPPRFVGFKGNITELLQCNPNLPPSQLPSVCQGVPQSIHHFQFFFSIGQTF